MATQKKRKAPRAPFIVTVATVAAASAAALSAIPGCGTTVSGAGACPDAAPAFGSECAVEGKACMYGEDECGFPIQYACNDGAWSPMYSGASCNPPFPTCPDTVPPQGGGCEELGMTCEYPGDGECVDAYMATCNDALAWDVSPLQSSCNPPGCPAEIPAAGDPCEPTWEPSCSYSVDTGCGPMEAVATCVDDVWQVGIPTCNPPPPEYCYTFSTEDECVQTEPFCRWLTPGCADPATPPPALAQAGCFPSFGCASSDECPAGLTCSEVVYDPCYMKKCDACGAVANLCVAP